MNNPPPPRPPLIRIKEGSMFMELVDIETGEVVGRRRIGNDDVIASWMISISIVIAILSVSYVSLG